MNNQNLLKFIEFLIETNRLADAFELKKNLKQQFPNAPEDDYIKAKNILDAFTLPREQDEMIYTFLQQDILRLIKTGISIKERLQKWVMVYPDSSQSLARFDLFSQLVQNREVIGENPLQMWMGKYVQSVGKDRKTTLQDKVNFIEKESRNTKLSEQDKKLLLNVLDLFDYLRPDISVDEISEEEGVIPIEPLSQKQPSTQPRGEFLRKQNQSIQQNSSVYSNEQARQNQTPKISLESLTLNKAFRKYPRVFNQPITSAKIILRGSREAVPGTLKNWMTNYQQEMGPAPHEPFERSQYLFHNKNALSLSPKERNILSEIFRSLDEDLELPIDTIKQEIALEQMQKRISSEVESSGKKSELGIEHSGKSQNSESRMVNREEDVKTQKTQVRPQKSNNSQLINHNSSSYIDKLTGTKRETTPQSQPIPTPTSPPQVQASPSSIPSPVRERGEHTIANNEARNKKQAEMQNLKMQDTASLQERFRKREKQFYGDMNRQASGRTDARTQRNDRSQSFQVPSSKQEDYTDYYPIPNTPQAPRAPMAKMEFREHQKFPRELHTNNEVRSTNQGEEKVRSQSKQVPQSQISKPQDPPIFPQVKPDPPQKSVPPMPPQKEPKPETETSLIIE